MGGAKPKLLLEIDGLSVLERSLQTLLAETRLARVVVACPADLIAD